MNPAEDGEDVGEFGGFGRVGNGVVQGGFEEVEPAVEELLGSLKAVGRGGVGHGWQGLRRLMSKSLPQVRMDFRNPWEIWEEWEEWEK